MGHLAGRELSGHRPHLGTSNWLAIPALVIPALVHETLARRAAREASDG